MIKLPFLSGMALMVFSQVGLAAVTAEDVWQNWQDMSKATGQAVAAQSVARDGDSLVVTGITVSSTQADARAEGKLSELRFTEAGDGTVDITIPSEYPVQMTMAAGPNRPKAIDMQVDITQEGMTLKASGDPDAVTYDLAAPVVKITLKRIDGVDTSNLTVEASFADIQGSYTAKGTADLTSSFTAGGLALAVVGNDAGDEIRLTSAIKDLALTTSGSLMGAMGGADMIAALGKGAASSTSLTTGSSDFDIEMTSAKGPTMIKGTTDKSTLLASIGPEGLDYSLDQKWLNATITSPDVPVPAMKLGIEEIMLGTKMPLAPSDASQAFGFQTRLINLALSDEIWAMFDPSGALPRDPLNLVIDADGMMKVSGDAAAPMPAQLQSLNLRELKLSLAGTELTGSGTGKMDYPVGGEPVPSAEMDFKLLGANALMDKLVAAGFLQAEQLMMPRMMLAMVAQADPAGGDTMLSKIIVKNKGVFANGQKLYDLP